MSSRISISLPCAMPWADMTPALGGRHCAACNKVVVDFTAYSAAEVVAYLQQHPNACGRFQPVHLGGTLPGWAPWLVALLASISSCEPPHAAVPLAALAEARVAGQHFVVRGVVVDKRTQQPLAHAFVVSEQDTSLLTRTATDGTFQLQLPLRLLGTRLVAAYMPSRNADGEVSVCLPKYFAADNGAPIRVLLRRLPPIIGAYKLEPDECHLHTVMPHFFASPPPPPVLSTVEFLPPKHEPEERP